MDNKIRRVISAFCIDGTLQEWIPYGNGHINDTYRLTFTDHGTTKRYILQKMNTNIFKNPEALMENISGVTAWLKHKVIENGGDPERETLNLVKTHDGQIYHIDSEHDYWRVYLFIENAVSYDIVKNDNDFYQSAVAFGRFQHLLADYPADKLYETIPNFHNTADRFLQLKQSVEADPCGRVKEVAQELQFAWERESLAHMICDLQNEKKLPLRVTHNDTKLNNVMIDNVTGTGICVIDLDTVMPGLSIYDFGDSIRFGASTAEEDEQDLSKVHFDLHLYELYVKGFLEGCQNALTDFELEMMPMGAITMTFECGTRFLKDYIDGDHYFKIHREKQNLDRCRTQFKLVTEMEEQLPQMKAIIEKYKHLK